MINIIFFSFISITIYELLCLSTDFQYSENYTSNYSNNHSFYGLNSDSFINDSIHLILIMDCTIFYNIEFLNCFYSNILLFYSFHFLLEEVYIDINSYNYFYIFQLRIITKVASDMLLCLSDSYNTISFYCLHDLICIIPYETSLVFFRLRNYSSYYIDCVSMYVVYPITYSYILVKLQCFCFSSLILNPFELIELPVIFFLDFYLNDLLVRNLYFFYFLIPRVI